MKYLFRIALISIGVMFIFINALSAQTITGIRDLPDTYASEECIEVSVQIDVDEANIPDSMVLKEFIPTDWTLQSATPANIDYKPATGEVKWLFLSLVGNPVKDMTIKYNVCAPAGECTEKAFSGDMQYMDPANGGADMIETTGGDAQIGCACVPASEVCDDGLDNDCDGTVDAADPDCTPVETITGTRNLPDTYGVEGCIEVSMQIDVDEANIPDSMVVKEFIPIDWTLQSATPANIDYKPATGEVKWLFLSLVGNPVQDMTITYNVCAPAGECTEKAFSGNLQYMDPANGNADTTEAIGGDTQVACVCVPEPEVCDGQDNNCDGVIDEGVLNACGECGDVPAEVCDGKDNDCDGETDEGVTNACGQCGDVPAEVCDGVDNDCDGETDEGLLNACGECGPVPEETCDGTDNDCDGQTDEGFAGLGEVCSAGLGECEAGGVYVCSADGTGMECSAEPGIPETEGPVGDMTCGDMLDNDCDGKIDSMDENCIMSIDLRKGFNLVSFPDTGIMANMTAYSLLGKLGGPEAVSSVQRFDPDTGVFETAGYQDGNPAGKDFPIKLFEGYIIYMKQDMVFYLE